MYLPSSIILYVGSLCLFLTISNQCTNSGYPFETYLASKTPYRIVSNKSFDRVVYDGCAPKKIWMLVRHGTRYPSGKKIHELRQRLPHIKELIVESDSVPNEFIRNRDLDLFRKWQIKLNVNDSKKLAHEGEEEMLLLAERMQSRFPDLFNPVYSNTSYKFKYTLSQRTKKSAHNFVSGLFGRKVAKHVWFPEPLAKDPILRFYKLCTKWRLEVKKNFMTYKERDEFLEGPEVENVVKEVNKRIGLEDVLDKDDILNIYTMCSFETAWNKYSKSPWCSLLSVDNFKTLVYAEDLKYYWQDGYGHELSYKQACPAFGDMMNFFESPDPYPKASVYFTHSGTLLKMLAHLGLYKEDQHLRADMYHKFKNKRKWFTSHIDSFGNNLAFVLFDCNEEGEKILVMHQEHIVSLPSCPGKELCEKQRINKYYVDSIDKCDFREMCMAGPSASADDEEKLK